MAVNDLDWRLLEAIEKDGRRTVSDLAADLGVSRSTVSEHLEQLKSTGVLRGFGADVDVERLGFGVSAFVRMTASSSQHRRVVAAVEDMPEVAECHVLTGRDLLMLRIIARDIAHLRSVVDGLTRYGDTQTDIVFATTRDRVSINARLRDAARPPQG